jgi:glycosyltransferase involved in cell wall biosynthesis
MNLVSIIIPAYNAEKYISTTINSVIQQVYNNWELIIINDGSTDKTEDVVKNFLHDKRIKYYYQNNTGVCGARNKGIEYSQGDFIAFLDADDAWLPENLEKKINALVNHSEIDWVFSDMFNADENLVKTGVVQVGTDNKILESILLWERAIVPGICSNLVIRKKCILSGICFDRALSTSADQDFCLQLAAKYTGKRISEPLFYYRILPESMSRNLATVEHDSIFVYKKAQQNKLFRSFAFQKKCFSNLYLILAGNWWVNGRNKLRGIYFIILALINYPPILGKLIKKFI